ncbi:hypothetical protein D3C75_527380 [compost metagenome]
MDRRLGQKLQRHRRNIEPVAVGGILPVDQRFGPVQADLKFRLLHLAAEGQLLQKPGGFGGQSDAFYAGVHQHRAITVQYEIFRPRVLGAEHSPADGLRIQIDDDGPFDLPGLFVLDRPGIRQQLPRQPPVNIGPGIDPCAIDGIAGAPQNLGVQKLLLAQHSLAGSKHLAVGNIVEVDLRHMLQAAAQIVQGVVQIPDHGIILVGQVGLHNLVKNRILIGVLQKQVVDFLKLAVHFLLQVLEDGSIAGKGHLRYGSAAVCRREPAHQGHRHTGQKRQINQEFHSDGYRIGKFALHSILPL